MYSAGIMFSIVPIIIFVGFILVFGLIIFRVVQGAAQWNRNNHSPILTVDASVAAKRTDVSHHHHNHGDNMHHTSTSTSYYVTFEFESGDRLELHVPSDEYGYLVEGDTGRLTFQGTRYKGFERFGDAV